MNFLGTKISLENFVGLYVTRGSSRFLQVCKVVPCPKHCPKFAEPPVIGSLGVSDNPQLSHKGRREYTTVEIFYRHNDNFGRTFDAMHTGPNPLVRRYTELGGKLNDLSARLKELFGEGISIN